jgi:hypothetical protein
LSELRLVTQLSLGLVFGVSGAAKLRDPAAFLRGVADYELLPRPAALVAGMLLMPLEGLLAAALLSGWLLGAAIPAATALLAVFTAAVAINLRRHRAVPCHCLGGGGNETISPRTLARLALLLAGVALLATDPQAWRQPLTSWTALRVTGGEDLMHALMLASLLLVAAGWLLHAPELWALARAASAAPSGVAHAAPRHGRGGPR